MKRLFYLIFLFLVHLFGNAQFLNKIPDSLSNYSFDELSKKVRLDNEYIKLYSDVYLIKAKQENDVLKIIRGYNLVGSINENLVTKLQYSDSAIALTKKKLPEELCLQYYKRGEIYYSVRRLKETLDSYLTALSYPSTVNGLECYLNYKIGTIKSIQQNHKEALAIFKKCVNDAKKYKYKNYVKYLLGLSEEYNRMDSITQSEKYVKLGLDNYKSSDKENLKPYFIAIRGKNYYKKKQYNLAIKDLNESLKEIEINKDYWNYIENIFFIAECYREMGLMKKAIALYEKIDIVFTKQNTIIPIVISTYDHLISYYKEQNNFEKVIYYSDQFIKADKQIDEDYKYITSKIAKNYDIQNVINTKEAIINKLESNNYIYIGLAFFLIISIVVLSFLYAKNIKKKREELQQQKKLYEDFKNTKKQTNIKEAVLKEKVKETANSIQIDDKVVQQILNALELFEKKKNYLKKEYTVESLASSLNTNSSYLSRIINDIKGCNFTQYLNKLRIEYLIDELENNPNLLKYSVQGLSEAAGYSNRQTFTRAFLSYTNMNPSDYVKQLKESIKK